MITDLDVHIGKQVRRRRIIMGMKQQELADRIGVAFQSIAKYECAENRLCPLRLWQLSQALQVPVSFFFEGYEIQVAA